MRSRLEGLSDTGRPMVVFLGDDIDEEDHGILFPALRERGVAVVRVHPADLVTHLVGPDITFEVAGQSLKPSLVVGWVLGELLTPGMAQLDVFARAGIPVINDALTLFRAQNKYLNSSMLSAGDALGYPVLIGRDPEPLARWLAELAGPAVSKPLVGFGGSGLRKLADAAEKQRFLAERQDSREPYYVVPWIENPGRDIRVYTINHHAVFACYRYAPAGDWITNIRAGGQLAQCPLTPELIEAAQRASRAAGTLIGGVDLAENQDSGELVVYEVNSCPTCEPPVLLALADFLARAASDLGEALATWRPEKLHDHLGEDRELFHASKLNRVRRS